MRRQWTQAYFSAISCRGLALEAGAVIHSSTVTQRAEPGRRIAFVAGCRTPFAKAGGFLADETSLDLARSVLAELLSRAELEASALDLVVLGTVVPNVQAPNLAREAALACGLPASTDAFTVSRACASANQAIVSAAQAIASRQADVVIAGGAESLSNVPILVSKPLSRSLVAASKAKTLGKRMKAFRGLKLKDVIPVPPAISEYSTGRTMGESAEKMAKETPI